jgi:hypothetical protein
MLSAKVKSVPHTSNLLLLLNFITSYARWSGLLGQETGIYKWEIALD